MRVIPSDRLCENPVHGSTGLTMNGHQTLQTKHLAVRLSFVDGLQRVFTQSGECEGSRKNSFGARNDISSLPNLATLRLCGRNSRIREIHHRINLPKLRKLRAIAMQRLAGWGNLVAPGFFRRQ